MLDGMQLNFFRRTMMHSGQFDASARRSECMKPVKVRDDASCDGVDHQYGGQLIQLVVRNNLAALLTLSHIPACTYRKSTQFLKKQAGSSIARTSLRMLHRVELILEPYHTASITTGVCPAG